MKVSRKWLQTYFDKELPSAEAISDAFTFHAFEIDSIEGDLLDVKVLPNRAADCLSHRGIAKELSAISDIPIKEDPLRTSLPKFPDTDEVSVEIEDSKKCLRYMAGLVKGVKVGPSDIWLKEALESVGQRSINNVVDATNYVMLNIGQPLHAFDAKKLGQKDGKFSIAVRATKGEEKIRTLDEKEYTLPNGTLVITDANEHNALGIAGIKGGLASQITEATTDILVESANFDGTSVRRTAQALKLFSDASQRFQNKPSPELCAYGIRDVLTLITKIAGGEVAGVVDVYPVKQETRTVSVTRNQINGLLGFNLEDISPIENVLVHRLGFEVKVDGDTFTVTPPFERVDLRIPEDLVEEVGRILGYEHAAPRELEPIDGTGNQSRYRGIERMKDQLVEKGFIEVSTQSFAKKGAIYLANPLNKDMPALRTSLENNLKDALARAKLNAPLVLAPNQKPKLFEVGTVFPKEGEYLELRMTEKVPEWGDAAATVDNLSIAKLEDYGKDYTPKQYALGTYKPFSVYPFIVRDIAMYLPKDFPEVTLRSVFDGIVANSIQNLSVGINFLDRFEKDGRTSYAFRLVFESMHRTLTDEEVNGIMIKVSEVLTKAGFEVR